MSAVPIRWRLAAGFSIAMAVVLLALGAFVYARVNDALRGSVDQTLRAQAAESSQHANDGGRLDSDARTSGTVEELIDPSGRVVRSSPAGLPALLARSELSAVRKGPAFYTIRRGAGEHNRWRVLGTPTGAGILVVATSLRSTEETLHHLLRGLILAGPLGLALATLGGYLLAAAALRPVEAMRRRAAAISVETPGTRLPVPQSRDEIRHLALTLNGMLERLEAGFAHERRFVADASHELRTPLALLKTELDLALRRPRSREELQAAVTSAAEETDRLVRLAEDLLLIAQSDQTDLPLRRERLDLADLAAESAARFSARADAEGRRLVTDVAAGLSVDADRFRLEQALGNMLDNALRHGRGTVTVSAFAENGAVELHVADEGPGFPEGFAQHAFERFSRADAARSGSGSGLGLAIVDAVVRAHGGTAGLTAVSSGADVWLRLPAAPLPASH